MWVGKKEYNSIIENILKLEEKCEKDNIDITFIADQGESNEEKWKELIESITDIRNRLSDLERIVVALQERVESIESAGAEHDTDIEDKLFADPATGLLSYKNYNPKPVVEARKRRAEARARKGEY